MTLRMMLASLLLGGCATTTEPDLLCNENVSPEPVEMAMPRPAADFALDDWMAGMVDAGTLAGLDVRIAKGDAIIYGHWSGLVDREVGRKIEEDTLYRMQSMTKPVMAATIMALVDAGKLTVDDAVADYLPTFADVRVHVSGSGEAMVTEPLARPLTVQDLLTHTSGMSFGFAEDDPVDALYREKAVFADGDTPQSRTTKIASVPLRAQPGGVWHYGASYEVLGRLAEIIEGKSLPLIMAERLFAPMGMMNSGFRFSDAALERAGPVYRKTADGLVEFEDPALDLSLNAMGASMTSGGNGLMMSAGDALTFGMMLANGGMVGGRRILSEASANAIVSNHLEPAQYPKMAGAEGLGFGYGGSVVISDEAAPRRIGEYGWGGVAGTLLLVQPEKRVAAVLMSQTMGASRMRGEWTDMVWKIVEAH